MRGRKWVTGLEKFKKEGVWGSEFFFVIVFFVKLVFVFSKRTCSLDEERRALEIYYKITVSLFFPACFVKQSWIIIFSRKNGNLLT